MEGEWRETVGASSFLVTNAAFLHLITSHFLGDKVPTIARLASKIIVFFTVLDFALAIGWLERLKARNTDSILFCFAS